MPAVDAGVAINADIELPALDTIEISFSLQPKMPHLWRNVIICSIKALFSSFFMNNHDYFNWLYTFSLFPILPFRLSTFFRGSRSLILMLSFTSWFI